MIPPQAATPPEHRVGLDGKWDVGIGLWFEGAVIERDTDLLPYRYRQTLTVGADYTFDLGTGLTALGEHFRLQESNDLFGSSETVQISALSMTYRISIVDQLSLIASHEWEGDESSFFLEWRRTWDRWRLHLIGFSAPEGGGARRTADRRALLRQRAPGGARLQSLTEDGGDVMNQHTSPNGKLIQLTGVTKTYPMGEGHIVALDDVSLGLRSGEFAGLVGPSGSGKTTLLNIVGTLDDAHLRQRRRARRRRGGARPQAAAGCATCTSASSSRPSTCCPFIRSSKTSSSRCCCWRQPAERATAAR